MRRVCIYSCLLAIVFAPGFYPIVSGEPNNEVETGNLANSSLQTEEIKANAKNLESTEDENRGERIETGPKLEWNYNVAEESELAVDPLKEKLEELLTESKRRQEEVRALLANFTTYKIEVACMTWVKDEEEWQNITAELIKALEQEKKARLALEIEKQYLKLEVSACKMKAKEEREQGWLDILRVIFAGEHRKGAEFLLESLQGEKKKNTDAEKRDKIHDEIDKSKKKQAFESSPTQSAREWIEVATKCVTLLGGVVGILNTLRAR